MGAAWVCGGGTVCGARVCRRTAIDTCDLRALRKSKIPGAPACEKPRPKRRFYQNVANASLSGPLHVARLDRRGLRVVRSSAHRRVRPGAGGALAELRPPLSGQPRPAEPRAAARRRRLLVPATL